MSNIGKQRLVVYQSSNGWRGVGTTAPQHLLLESENLSYGVGYRTNENLISDTRMVGTDSIIHDDQKPEGDISFIPSPNSIDNVLRSHYQKAELTPSTKFGDTWQYTPEKGRLSWDGGVVYGTGGFSASAGDVFDVGVLRIYDDDQVVAFNHGVCDELSFNVSANGVLKANAKYKFLTAGTLGTTTPWADSDQDDYPPYSSFVGTFLVNDVAVPIEKFSVTSKNNMIEKMILGQNTRDSFTMGDYTVEGDFSLDFPDDGLTYLTDALSKNQGKISGTFYQEEYSHLTFDIPNIVYKPNDIKLNSIRNAVIGFEAFSNNGTSPITVRLQKPPERNIDSETIGSLSNTPGYASIGLDTSNSPAIAYKYGFNELYYATRNNSTWNIEVVLVDTDIALHNSLHIGSDNIPHIAFMTTAKKAVVSEYTGGTWGTTILGDSSSSSYLDSALDSNNLLGVVYPNINGFQYSQYSGSSWTTITNPHHKSIYGVDFDSSNVPYFVSKGTVSNDVYVSNYTGTVWSTSAITTVADADIYDIAVKSNGYAAIAILDNVIAAKELRYLWDYGAGWDEMVVATFTNSFNSDRVRLKFDSEDNPIITYSDNDADTTNIARLIGGVWEIIELNPYNKGSKNSDIVIEDDNTYHVCHDDVDNDSYVHYNKVTWGEYNEPTTPHQLDSGTANRTISEYSQYDAGTASRTISEYARQDRDIK